MPPNIFRGFQHEQDLPKTLSFTIDHCNRQRDDNRLENLEYADLLRQARNTKTYPNKLRRALKSFLSGCKLDDAISDYGEDLLLQVPECLFIFTYDDIAGIYEESDWVYKPNFDWKNADKKCLDLFDPPMRTDSILKVCSYYEEEVGDEWKKNDKLKLKLLMFYNAMFSYWFGKLYPDQPSYSLDDPFSVYENEIAAKEDETGDDKESKMQRSR